MKTISLLTSAVAVSSLAIAFTSPVFAAALSSIVCSALVVLTLSRDYSNKSRTRFSRLYASSTLTRTSPLRLAA
jgi:hypothetical protein